MSPASEDAAWMQTNTAALNGNHTNAGTTPKQKAKLAVVQPPTRAPLRTIRVDAIEARSIKWLDRPLLQGAAFTLVAGPKGVGKGTWLSKTIAKVSRGIYGPATNVLIVSSEDSAAIDVKPRLMAAEADLTRVHSIPDAIMLPADLDRLRDLARSIGNVGLIVIDPLGNHLGGADTDKEGAVRYAIGGLNQMADELDCAVIGVRHIGKSRQNGAVSAVLGSTAWVDLPRAVLMFAPDDEDEMVFHVHIVAGNRSGRGAGQAYRIELRDVGLDEPVTYAVELGDSTKSSDQLLATTAAPRGEKRTSAKQLILDELADGPKPLDTLKAKGAAIGISGETVYRAATELKTEGRAKARNSGPGTQWLWHLQPTNADFVTNTTEAA